MIYPVLRAERMDSSTLTMNTHTASRRVSEQSPVLCVRSLKE